MTSIGIDSQETNQYIDLQNLKIVPKWSNGSISQ